MRQAIHDHLTFYRQFRERFETTGAIAPSSRFLAQALTRPLAMRKESARILEVGPGTGAVTRFVVAQLRDQDQFDLVELNPQFVQLLNGRFDSDPHYQRVAAQSNVHAVPLQEFESHAPYDFIVSGLPLNNFPVPLVEEIFESFLRLLTPGGTLSYFEYMYVRPMRRLVAKNEEKERLAALEAILRKYLGTYRIRQDWVFANMPPAWVQHLRKG